MKKSIRDRIKITKNGKVLHRPIGLGHSKAKRRTNQRLRKGNLRSLDIDAKKAKELLHR